MDTRKKNWQTSSNPTLDFWFYDFVFCETINSKKRKEKQRSGCKMNTAMKILLGLYILGVKVKRGGSERLRERGRERDTQRIRKRKIERIARIERKKILNIGYYLKFSSYKSIDIGCNFVATFHGVLFSVSLPIAFIFSSTCIHLLM